MLLTVRNITKSYGAVTVLESVTFALEPGEHAGLVGANGAGKSTLLRIITGEETADSGEVQLATDQEMGYLPQTLPHDAGRTIDDVLADALGGLRSIEVRMRTLEAAMATTSGEALDALLAEYGHLASQFQDRGGYEMEARMDAILAGLRLDYLPRSRQLDTLSGGERARVGLALLLLRAPGLLLLDEPTSHLDAASLSWLEAYLANYPGAALIVSHDRQFLNRGVNRILELDEYSHTLRRYGGNYDAYQQAKAAERIAWEESFARQREEIKELRKRIRESAHQVAHNRKPKDNDKLGYKGKGEWVADTISRNVRAAEEQLRRLEANPVPRPPRLMHFHPKFRADALRANAIVRLEHVNKCYDGRQVLHDVTLTLLPDARVALVGPNGAGKTTLLRVLLGLEQPDSGSVRLAPGVRIGYLPQEPAVGSGERTVFDAYREGLEGYESNLVAGILGNGLFRLEDLTKTIAQLSPGQKRKLELARLLALGPNMLLLDEPSNYVSLDVLEVFEAAVLAFPGPVLLISHDRWLLNRFGGDVWELTDGELRAVEASAPSLGVASL
ncbi:MAG TPA: ABC-F family ATP-binding cassette domain-containing protein [Ktedonobacterales bacterium]|nr:ABC-F family ATP-binding cassette domain-containing protein [Ktedonobacterales bacterium]